MKIIKLLFAAMFLMAIQNVCNAQNTVTIEAESFNETGGTIDDSPWGGPGLGVNRAGTVINWVNSGDWAEYTNISVPATGEYEITYSISSPNDNAEITFSVNGSAVAVDAVPNNGSWDSYQPLVSATKINLSVGTATFRVTASGTNSWQWNLDNIVLTQVEVEDPTLIVTPETATVEVTGTVTLNAELLPSDLTDPIVWGTSDASVATVSTSGVVTGVGVGQATITATSVNGTVSDNCIVTVTDNEPPTSVWQVGASNNIYYTNGKVSINTTTPSADAELTVNGVIDCEGVEVRNVGADFVFEESYNLRSLQEVKAFIDANGHLPDVAPASETEKGIELGEFNQTLLQKIEELTLYIIEVNEDLNTLKSENQQLKEEISELKK